MSCFVVFAVRFEKQNTTKKKKEINADGPFFFFLHNFLIVFYPLSKGKVNTSALFISQTNTPSRTCIVAALWSWCRGTLGINNNNNNYNKKSVGSFHFFFSFSQLGNHKPVLLAILDSGFFFSVEDWFDKALAFYPSDSSFFFLVLQCIADHTRNISIPVFFKTARHALGYRAAFACADAHCTKHAR